MVRRPNLFLQELVESEFTHAQLTVDLLTEMYEVPVGRSLVLDRVLYVSSTGLAASDTDFVIIKVLNGSAVAASWSTKATGGNGALPIGILVKPALSSVPSDVNARPGTRIKLSLDLTGAPTLPLGKVRVEGRLL
jgi:hypothetical protein